MTQNSDIQKQFQSLTPEDQQKVAERLLKVQQSGWKPFWCQYPTCPGTRYGSDENGDRIEDPLWQHGDDPKWQHNHARADQRLLPWSKPWMLMIMSGRGSGKTEVGAQYIHLCHRKGVDTAILGRRGTELVNTHVKRILETAHPEFKPEYFASKDILVWPNGTTTYLFSAEKPENIRSINVGAFWADEAAFMPEIETAWMNLKLATRIETPGNPVHGLITTTPTSTPWVMEMEDDPDVTIRRVSTYANKANLSADFMKDMEKRYEGTRMGRQELHGEVLRDVEGAFWNDDMYVHERVDAVGFQALLEAFDDIVVAVDPAGSKGPRSDATGIIAVGVIHESSKFYVLADGTIKGSPTEWAERAYKVARLVKANRIIVEKNFGGDMVKQTLRDFAALKPLLGKDHEGNEYRIVLEHAVKSKETRAEPVVGKYEQHRVVHVVSPTAFGDVSALEVEQTMWVPKSRGGKFPSPNRIDACLAEGTMILLGDGVTEKSIEMIQPGEMVMTRRGPRRVVRAWVSRENAIVMGRVVSEGVSGNREIWATPDHKIWTDTPDEWVNMGSDTSVWGRILVWNTQTRRPSLSTWTGWASDGSGTPEALASEPTVSTTLRPQNPFGMTEIENKSSGPDFSVPAGAPVRLEARVWDMEVEDEHEFFANGILVHNCVWAVSNLEKGIKFDTAMANQRDVLRSLKKKRFGI